MFSMYINLQNERRSHILFGGYEMDAIAVDYRNNRIMQFNTVNSSSWALNLTSFSIGDYKMNLLNYRAKVLFDPSLPFIYMPQPFYQQFFTNYNESLTKFY